eukprot:426152-Prymnesium_polylepis.2
MRARSGGDTVVLSVTQSPLVHTSPDLFTSPCDERCCRSSPQLVSTNSSSNEKQRAGRCVASANGPASSGWRGGAAASLGLAATSRSQRLMSAPTSSSPSALRCVPASIVQRRQCRDEEAQCASAKKALRRDKDDTK